MSKIADYLRERITGEVSVDPIVRKNFSTDGSVFQKVPQAVLFPRTTNDIRKLARFAWRLAERGQVLPITPRGGGTDPTGGSIGGGVVVSFPAHLSRILELDTKSRLVRVQPGLSMSTLQEAMATHGLSLPLSPDDPKSTTIGGALGCNLAGSKSVKYRNLRNWTDRVEVVLANGEIIQTGPISRHELNSKKGLQTMEGEIYRSIDSLIEDNAEIIEQIKSREIVNVGGYAIDMVKQKDGSFDLTPLLVGSQGTLGIIVQAIMKLEVQPSDVVTIAAALTSDHDLESLTEKLLALEPSELEFIDGDTFKLIESSGGGRPWKTVADKLPESMIFVEFDDKHKSRKLRKAGKILDECGVIDARIATEWEDQESLRSIHQSVSTIVSLNDNGVAALPIAPDVTVSPVQVVDLVKIIKKLLKRHHVEGGIWGHVGSGTISVRLLINLANLGQRQIVFKFINELNASVNDMGGSMSGGIGEGRLLSSLAAGQDNEKLYNLFKGIKQAFDPYNTLNPGVKFGSEQSDLLALLRQEYDTSRFSEFNSRG